MKRTDKPVVECKVCRKVMDSKFALKNHMRVAHAQREFQHVPLPCDQAFYDRRR